LTGLLGRGIGSLQGPYLQTTTEITEKYRHKSTSLMGFEPTIPVFELSKTVDDEGNLKDRNE
jgi:hypothetical protein